MKNRNLVRLASAGLGVLALGYAACSSPDSDANGESASAKMALVNHDLYGLGTIAKVWPNGVVPVCFQDTTSYPALQTDIPGLLAKSWSAAANITFTGFGACHAEEAEVTVTFANPNVDGGQTYRGSTLGGGYGTPVIELISDDSAPGHPHFNYEVIHEFGHALGFVHEMQRPDNWIGDAAVQCPPDSVADEQNYLPIPGGIYLTKTYDPSSIMNYCNPATWPQALSAGDIAGASSASAYGPTNVPNCTLTSTCSYEDIPSRSTFQNLETVTGTCASGPSGMEELSGTSTWSWLSPFVANAALPYETSTNVFDLPSASVGGEVTVKACNTVDGGVYCDFPTTLTVGSCPAATGGGTKCTVGTCAKGFAWDPALCECVASGTSCTTAECVCKENGGRWVGSICQYQ